MSNYYKVNIDYIRNDNNWIASFPEIPQLRGIGTDHETALDNLMATYSAFTASGGYSPMPLSKTSTY